MTPEPQSTISRILTNDETGVQTGFNQKKKDNFRAALEHTPYHQIDDTTVSLIERKIRMNMANENIEKLPILPQGMNTKKPTWNNIRYFFRNVHYSQIVRDGVCIQSVVKGLRFLHEQINRLLEIPNTIYKNLQDGWWQFQHD